MKKARIIECIFSNKTNGYLIKILDRLTKWGENCTLEKNRILLGYPKREQAAAFAKKWGIKYAPSYTDLDVESMEKISKMAKMKFSGEEISRALKVRIDAVLYYLNGKIENTGDPVSAAPAEDKALELRRIHREAQLRRYAKMTPEQKRKMKEQLAKARKAQKLLRKQNLYKQSLEDIKHQIHKSS